MENDRRDFFRTVGAATAGAMLAGPRAVEAAVTADSAAEAAVIANPYVPAYRHGMIFGGVTQEILGFEGGDFRGVVVANELGGRYQKKNIAEVSMDDITLSLGASQSPELYAWVKATVDGNYLTKNGSLVAADRQGNPRSQIDFLNALITEVKFPALDSLHKAPAELTVIFSPEQAVKSTPASTTRINTKQKNWFGSNFRLRINGLDESCARVTKIDSFTIKQTFRAGSGGGLVADAVKVSDLVLWCPEKFADQLVAWHEDFVIQKHYTDTDEKSGTLEFLAPDQKTVYFTLSLSHLGIFGCALEGAEKKMAVNRLVKAEIYCEQVSLTIGAIPG